jgi:hypothetical protein
MKLYCICGPCGKKMILPNKARTRYHLATQIGQTFNITCGHCKTMSDGNTKIVYAGSSYKYAQAPGALSGIAMGAFFGPLGSIIGGVVGAVSGTGIKNSDKAEVNAFNNS